MKRILILLLSINIAILSYAQGNSIPKSSKAKVQAEEQPEILPEDVKYRYPLFNGLSVSTNIFDPVMEMFKWDHANYGATVTADFHHRFFPQLSFGLGHCNQENEDNGLKYVSKAAPYFKTGMLYNFKYNETKPENYYYVLARVGFSKSKGDFENLKYTDGYWIDYGPETINDQDFSCSWVELGGGIKVKLTGPISLGWEISLRPMLSNGNNKYGKPYFVPGRGTSSFCFEFNLSYDIF